MSGAEAKSDLETGAGADVLASAQAGGHVIRGSFWRALAGLGGSLVAIASASLLLRHLGVAESGRYVTIISLLAVPITVADIGLNISGSRWLALRRPHERDRLIANILGQRLILMPAGVLLMVLFALIAGYPSRMVLGTLVAGCGFILVAVSNALLLRLAVELRNGGLALIDFLRQAVTFVGIAILVALDARLGAFFAVQLAVGMVVVALVPILIGWRGLVRPRLDRAEQRLLTRSALPLAMALALGQVYFRLVIVLMSLISTPKQTGYFGASLRAIEAPISISILVAGVALPLLAAAARDDRTRFLNALAGLSKGAFIAGVLIVVLAARGGVPVMEAIGGRAFRAAGVVLSIQAAMLLFNALYQVWTVALLALGRQRDLIGTNLAALLGLGVFAGVLVPAFGAEGGAMASVMGDALLAGLIYWRLRAATGPLDLGASFFLRVGAAALPAAGLLAISAIPSLVDALLAAIAYLAVGHYVGMVPPEVYDALLVRLPFLRRASTVER